jgi:magnesium-transporting ATPase (P-type)
MTNPTNPTPAAPTMLHLWHAMPAEDVLNILDTGNAGLDQSEAARRLAIAGANRLPATRERSPIRRFIAQFDNLLIYVLLASAVITFVLGHRLDASVILAVVLLNAIIGFVQEGRAEAALDAIRAMLSPSAAVIRAGQRITVDAHELVPGDVVLLDPGDKVPADLRLIRTRNLRVDEAALTGESVQVHKSPEEVDGDTVLGDRGSVAFSGTLVAAGQGVGVVVGTGAATELGRVSALVGSVNTLKTPLLRQIDIFARHLTYAILVLSVAIYGFAVMARGYAPEEAFLIVIGVAVAAIPEGLPAVMTIALAIGVRRMAARQAIIRRLPAVETLGSVSTICTDKTGTLTRNEMTVASAEIAAGTFSVSGVGYDPAGTIAFEDESIQPTEYSPLAEMACTALLGSDAVLHMSDAGWLVEGDPMEGALVVFAVKAGLDAELIRQRFPRLDEIPFDADHRFMATLHQADGEGTFVCLKGAPEQILAMCDRQRTAAGEQAIEEHLWHTRVHEMATRGQRVIAIATKDMLAETKALSTATLGDGFTILGLIGLIDPPREEAWTAVRACQTAGIRVKMITGDHAETAAAIAGQLGIETPEATMTGAELDRLDDTALRGALHHTDIFARTTPEHKLRLVTALQAGGAIMAMTGDGVNDAPALKRADVGVAMGRKGTEAAKEAADMVLADDNFASIVDAVQEGRTVYDNVQKVIAWTLPTNGGEALAIIGALLLGLTLPMTAVQILWINMVTAVALGLTLAFEPPEPGSMQRSPRAADKPVLSAFVVWRIVFVSVLFVFGVYGVFLWADNRGLSLEAARTLAVNTIVVMEIFYLFSIRFRHGASLTWRGLLGTPAVLAGVGTVIPLQLAFTYAPPLQVLFDTRPLNLIDGGVALGTGLLLFLILEVEKLTRKHVSTRSSHHGRA